MKRSSGFGWFLLVILAMIVLVQVMQPSSAPEDNSAALAEARVATGGAQSLDDIMARQRGVLITSCDVNFGSSGAPIFSFESGAPRVVSIVSAMAEVDGQKVSLGTQLEKPLELLHAELAAGKGVFQETAPRMFSSGEKRNTGAKFSKPQ